MTLGKMLTVTEFAAKCGMTPGRVRQLIAKGELPTERATAGARTVMHFVDPKHIGKFSEPALIGRKRISARA